MSEPNPYEPPQSAEPLKPAQVVKRAVGLGAILLLTPPAWLITLGIACGAGRFAPRFLTLGPPGMFVMLVLPLIVLAGMMAWAVWTVKRDPCPGEKTRRRIRLLLLTPIAVAAMMPIGFGLMFALGAALYGRNGFPFPWVVYVLCLLFVIPPGGTLLWMLSLAWQENDKSARPREAPRPGD